MILFRLNEALAKRGWSAYKLSQESGVREDVIGLYRNNQVKHAVLAQLNKMCAALECGVGDLMEFVPDKAKPKAKAAAAAKKR